MKIPGKNTDSLSSLILFEEKYFDTAAIPYSKHKEDVWHEIQALLNTADTGKPGSASVIPNKLVTSSFVVFLAAASVLLLLAITGFLRYYALTVVSGNGKHLTATLPDNSSVKLNAQSTLTYHPYWWFVSRKIEFTGEGFFEITKGKKLEISSSNGKTIVLGTSFNIYSRNSDYKVTCFSGKVKVVSPTAEEVVLTPDYHAEIDQNGNISMTKLENPELKTGWIDNMFSFTATPLKAVFSEIEQQYGISIEYSPGNEFVYTGYFSKDKSVDTVINLICKPFGLTFVKKTDKQYLIVQE